MVVSESLLSRGHKNTVSLPGTFRLLRLACSAHRRGGKPRTRSPNSGCE